MVEVKKSEQKGLLLDILKEIDRVSRENGIKYFLFFGTLIGAVRHKGFIPWDDDVDICIFREDLPKLKKALEGNERFRLLTTDDKGYYYYFGKVVDKRTRLTEARFKEIPGMGLYVDVFILENLGDNDIELYKSVEKEVRRQLSWGKQFPRREDLSLPRYIRRILSRCKNKLVGLKVHVRKYENKVKKYTLSESKDVSVIGTIYHDKCIFPKEWFSETIELDFEGEKFLGPKDYDKVLTKIYGDYMTLPPEEKRSSGHNYKAYFR